ncbi:TPA: copper chaperone [Candidatus Poribacteria bacterium]|nr:copper chaperone [Candidatus Poribacteria bacterium]
MAKVKTALKVEGMTCEHCVATVTKALQGLDGVKRAKVNLKKGKALVTYDSEKIGANALTKAVIDVGYEASVA